MKSLQKNRASSSTHTQWTQLLYHCLPIAGTGLLMFWLSGGLYPHTWLLYVRTCAQFSLLWTELGAGFLVSFAILTVQSLLLAIAWGLLLWLAIREVYALFSGRLPAAPPPVSRGPKPLSPAAVASPLQSIHYAAPPPAPYASQPAAASSRQDMVVRENPFESTAPLFANPALENPFEEQEPSDSVEKSRGVQRLPKQDALLVPLFEEEVQPDALPDYLQVVVEHGQRMRTEASEIEAKEEASNPFHEPESEQEQANFSSVLHELGFFRLDQPSTKGKSALSQPEKEMGYLANVPSNTGDDSDVASPFDVQSDVLHMFSTPDVPGKEPGGQIAKGKLKQPQPQAQPAPAHMEPDQIYKLGNPFEGTLPEVFQQDEDLKHSVLEQMSEELEQRASQRKQAVNQAVTSSEKKTARRPPRKKLD